MATVKEINHDSSTTLADHYTTIDNDGTAITVNVAAALNGSTNGIEVDFDLASGKDINELTEPFTLTGTDFRWRMRLKLAAFSNTANSGDEGVDFWIRNTASAQLFVIYLESDGSNGWQIHAEGRSDESNVQDIATGAVSSSDEICIELKAVKEVSNGSGDGTAELFINGVSQGSKNDIGNFNRWDAGMGETFIEFNTGNASFTDSLYYDEWILDDNSASALCPAPFTGYALVLGGGQP